MTIPVKHIKHYSVGHKISNQFKSKTSHILIEYPESDFMSIRFLRTLFCSRKKTIVHHLRKGDFLHWCDFRT